MRSAAQFFALLVVGVFIVVIYNWSGNSLVVLILTLLTVIVLLALYVIRPWEIAADRNQAREATSNQAAPVSGQINPDRGEAAKTTKTAKPKRMKKRSPAAGKEPSAASPVPKSPIWRAKFDVSSNAQELTGVPVGQRRSQTWSWVGIDAISSDWCEEMVGTEVKAKLGLRLDFPENHNPEKPTSTMVALGPRQVLDDVIAEARANWRSSKIPRSRYYDLDAEERTLNLMADLGHGRHGLADQRAPADILYREGVKALLRTGLLCRLPGDCPPKALVDGFDALLTERGVAELNQAEADDLLHAALPPNPVAAGYELLDWLAQLRACRLAFVDHGGRDYVIGLLPSEAANHWDGQTVGGGVAQVLLGLPK